jgi:DNA-binding MarR family transcriptional regulator
MQAIADLDYLRTRARISEYAVTQQAKDVGLTLAQLDLLLAIYMFGGGDAAPTIGDVAQLLLLRHNSTVELADRVQALGLIGRRRDEQDRRVVRLSLTDRGQACLADVARRRTASVSS